MPKKRGNASKSNAQQYNKSKNQIGKFVAAKDFEKAKDLYDKLFKALREKQTPKAKIGECKIEVDRLIMDQVQPGFSVKEVKSLVVGFEIRLPELVRTSTNSKGRKEGHNFCAIATDVLYKCWQGNAENVKNLLEFFLARGLSIESDFPYNDMLIHATTRYHHDHEFIRALLATERLEVNRYMIVEDENIMSAFMLSKSSGNVDLVSVFLEFGADPNFIDIAANTNPVLSGKMQKGELAAVASNEIALLSEGQRLESFSATDAVIEKFYLNKLRNLLGRLDTGAAAAQEGAASVGVDVIKIIDEFDQYLLYKQGASQEPMLLNGAQLNHTIEVCVLRYILESPDIKSRKIELLDEMQELMREVVNVQDIANNQALFVRLFAISPADPVSFKVEIIRNFLDFKGYGQLSDRDVPAQDDSVEFVLAAGGDIKKSDATADTVPGDEEEDSLESPESRPQEDEWGQLAAEIGGFSLEADVESAEDPEGYASGESDDEEERGIYKSLPLNLAQLRAWSVAAVPGKGWGGGAGVVFEVQESEESNGFFGNELPAADDGLGGDLGFFGDMSKFEWQELEMSLAGNYRDGDEDEFNALEE